MQLTFESGPRAGQSLTIEPGRSVVIGRDPAADVFIDDPRVSRPHARVWVDATGGPRIEDLKSTNGTFVNGSRIASATPLRSGDSVSIGNTRFTIVADAAGGEATVVADVQVTRPAGASRPSMVMLRQSVASANRTAQVAVGVAAVVVVVVVAAAVWLLVLGRQATNEEIATRLTPSIVRIVVQSSSDLDPGGSGTGWVLDASRGVIVTNNHVINGGSRVTVTGEGLTPRTANIVAAAPCDDVAVIHVDDNAGLVTAAQGSQDALHQGDDVISLGYPITGSSQANLVFTAGTISVVKTTFEGGGDFGGIPNLPNVLQHSARINPGNSGGPLVNKSGEVVGMNSIGISSLDQNYAIGIDRVKAIVPDLEQGKGLAWTGIGITTAAALANDWGVPDTADMSGADLVLTALGLPAADGLVVLTVNPGSEADLTGLFGKFPILVTAVDGHAVPDMASYCEVAAPRANGDQATFSVAWLDPQTGETVARDVNLHYR
jgi:S1-C subfamily serine protease